MLFQNGFFFPPPAESTRGIFLWYSMWAPGWAPGGKTHKNVGASLWLGLSGVFISQTCSQWASSNLTIIVQVAPPCTGSHGGFGLWVSAAGNGDSQHSPACLSNSVGSSLPCDLTFFMDLRRRVDFPGCSAFYLLLGWTGDFHAPPLKNCLLIL